jgi:hypothetical protein
VECFLTEKYPFPTWGRRRGGSVRHMKEKMWGVGIRKDNQRNEYDQILMHTICMYGSTIMALLYAI